MKVFISLPMHGRTDKEIQQNLKEARSAISLIFPDQELTILHNYGCIAPSHAGRLFYLGSAIQRMDGADAVYFCKGWEEAKGCKIEHDICELYGIQRIES